MLAVPDDELSHVAAGRRSPTRAASSSTCRARSASTSSSPHPRRASLHPLVPLPNAEIGADRLLGGVTLAVAGDPVAARSARASARAS